MYSKIIQSFLVETLSSLHGVSLKAQTIPNAYLLFKVLATKTHDFKCSVCGNHLWMLITHVNRKIAFKNNVEEVEINE